MIASERQALALLVNAQVREQEELRRKDRELARALVAPPRRKRRRPPSRCIYCGGRAFGRACNAHRDLIQIETAAVA